MAYCLHGFCDGLDREFNVVLDDPVFIAHVKQLVLDILVAVMYLIRTRNSRGTDKEISSG